MTQGRRVLRLMLVTETFPPEVNGVARTLGRWVETFQKRGHLVRVVRPRQPGEAKELERVYGMALPFYRQVRLGVAGPLRLLRILDKHGPDLVHIATEGPLGLSALLSCLWRGIPVASSFHTNFDHYANHYAFWGADYLAFAYLRWFHNRTAVTLVPSKETQRRLSQAGIQRVEIWTRGVDGQAFHPQHRDESLRAELGLGPHGVLVIYVGRLAVEKNLGVLLQAFARLRATLPPEQRDQVRLALVGDGPLTETLQAHTPPGVHLAGERHGAELSRWYASGDLFAFPSVSETFGNVVLEAQASGLPVVGFDSQGVNEQVTSEVNGYLVPPEGDLVPYLQRLCLDEALRRRMGQAARDRAERLDWNPIFDELEQRYYALCGGSPP
ncbi:MAG: glycosyltransferase family 1 protein [Gemmataceae bacterium]